MKSTIIKFFWRTLGGLSLLFGLIGLLLPIVPQTPFFLFAIYCISKTSPEFRTWVETLTVYQRTANVLPKGYRGARPRVDVTPE